MRFAARGPLVGAVHGAALSGPSVPRDRGRRPRGVDQPGAAETTSSTRPTHHDEELDHRGLGARRRSPSRCPSRSSAGPTAQGCTVCGRGTPRLAQRARAEEENSAGRRKLREIRLEVGPGRRGREGDVPATSPAAKRRRRTALDDEQRTRKTSTTAEGSVDPPIQTDGGAKKERFEASTTPQRGRTTNASESATSGRRVRDARVGERRDDRHRRAARFASRGGSSGGARNGTARQAIADERVSRRHSAIGTRSSSSSATDENQWAHGDEVNVPSRGVVDDQGAGLAPRASCEDPVVRALDAAARRPARLGLAVRIGGPSPSPAALLATSKAC